MFSWFDFRFWLLVKLVYVMKKMSNEWAVLWVKTRCYVTGFQLAKTKQFWRCLFPCEMLPLWALFQMFFCIPKHWVQTVLPLLHRFPSLFLSHCLHQPPLAMVLSSPQLEHWPRTSVSLCGLDASIPSLPVPCFYSLSSLFLGSDQSSAVGSPRGWEIPATRSHCMTLYYKTT